MAPALVSSLLFLALAHVDTDSVASLEVVDGAWQLRIEVDADRMMQTVGSARPDGFAWTAREVERHEADLLAYLAAHLRLERDGEAWVASPRYADLLTRLDPILGIERSMRLEARYALEAPGGDFELSVSQDLFLDTETAHQNRFRWMGDAELREWGTFVGHPLRLLVEDPTEEGRRHRVERYRRSGFDAARVDGWAAAMLLVGALGVSSWLSLFGLGMCFSLALWATATLAALDHVGPSEALVAIAIPFSVAYVAAENLFSKDRKLRWVTCGLFGCVFGLAYDPRLEALGLPELAREDCSSAYTLAAAGTLAAAFLVAAPLLRTTARDQRWARGLRATLSVVVGGWAALSLVREVF